ncbi:glycoside hydrolase family 2 TIM barrel-domain containing protein [Mucilaginibacter sp. Mucisp86]|uniref:glycoside hydrolase family 2 TIM barrel-domain containing protein n=1 Tax=Mucilaginibacter sp. Mucisp86 TaxID=3243060 RepID=UPI0039B6DF52
MKKFFSVFLLFTITTVTAQIKTSVRYPNNRTTSFDSNWRFLKDSIANGEGVAINDSKWKKVDLPHDWSIDDLPNQSEGSIVGPFDKSSPGLTQTGFTRGGTGWYRKKFRIQSWLKDKHVVIHFDGVYMNSDVWLNGHHLGNHPYGYTPFYYDLTPFLKAGNQENTLAVRVRNEGQNSRWYSGSGIYRHVWLNITGPVAIAPWGIYITTPKVSMGKASVNIQAMINNAGPVRRQIQVVTTFLSPEGKVVGNTRSNLIIDPAVSKKTEETILISNPSVWSVERPSLYKAVTQINEGNNVLDRIETIFGIRSLSFSPENGLLLNGKHVLLKGGCIHHDNGPLGSVTIDRAEERKIELLKNNGFNAVRLTHNPPSTQLLNACDRMGMLVIDEAYDMWEKPKTPNDYHQFFKEWWQRDLQNMILRDRNHPSVIIWSIGNELPEVLDTAGVRIVKQLVNEVHRLDPTRPTTEAVCKCWDSANKDKHWSMTIPTFALLDVSGYNYLWREYEKDHKEFPYRIIVGTETLPQEALENWKVAEKNRYVLGDFVWTAMDYLGEAGLGNAYYDTKQSYKSNSWPWYNAWCGDIDLIGQKKPQSYYRDVVWSKRPIAMAVHEPMPDGMIENISPWGWPQEQQSWTWPGVEGKSLKVRVFSRAPMVRLKLNGKVVGEQAITDTSITAVFNVAYHPGTLEAVNVENGKETAAFVLKTAGTAKRIRLIADHRRIKASKNDLSYVTVEVVDENNQVVPNSEVLIHFSVEGSGELAAVGNANPTDVASFHQKERKTFNGRCLAILRPNGKAGVITLKATAKELTGTQIVVTTH